jgi:carboxyl-terminal processing protease
MNLQADLERVNIDTTSRSKNETWMKALKKDVYLSETTNILHDWITSSAKVVNMNTTLSE